VASNDWTTLGNGLLSPNVEHGVTAGITGPNGGGSFCYAVNSLTNVQGVVGRYASPQSPNTDFNPLLKGGEITAALQRGVGGGQTGMAAMLFALLQGTDVSDDAYILGLADGDPSHIVLRKGSLALGLPDEAPDPDGANGILRRSTATYAPGTWVHLRLEAVVNDNGDVVLNCYQNDLTANTVDAPNWEPIPGMAQFIDDLAGVNTGSTPYASGRIGFAARVEDSVRRCFFDHFTVTKQP
jgi:hypothetical protein